MCLSSTCISNVYFINMPDRDESEGACCILMFFDMLFCSNILHCKYAFEFADFFVLMILF